ncbi:hypothetical protein [Sphingobium lactosutens]|uniref:Uncharacterized protein n=1 Tax=Sphingobium lactosutens DS20 TaxID=1331060 RepID=T0I1A5_9SPHN|nr:hypothetical protein [Sphingobium lactosutens]EQB19092.1 hypothetical protein RLDS_00545 [Sphingobium lactosutens DS20]
MGSCRPDFLIELRSRSTGECKQLIVEAVGSSDEAQLAAKAAARPALLQIAPVATLKVTDLEQNRWGSTIRSMLDL